VPENIECLKYLRDFMDRRGISTDRIKHLGWIDNSIEGHIKSLERQEVNRSKLRSQVPIQKPVAPQSFLPTGPAAGNTGIQAGLDPSPINNNQSFGSPIYTQPFGSPIYTQPDPLDTKASPKGIITAPITDPALNAFTSIMQQPLNNQCTQGELGLDQQRKYNLEDLELQLEDLKKAPLDMLAPQDAEDMLRRIARGQDFYDDLLLKALGDDKPSFSNPTRQSMINPLNTGGIKNPIEVEAAPQDCPQHTGLQRDPLPIDLTGGFKPNLIVSNFMPGRGGGDFGGYNSGYEQNVPNYYEKSDGEHFGYGQSPTSYMPPVKSYLAPNPKLSKDSFVQLLRRVGT
jgi:hypothetical protein